MTGGCGCGCRCGCRTLTEHMSFALRQYLHLAHARLVHLVRCPRSFASRWSSLAPEVSAFTWLQRWGVQRQKEARFFSRARRWGRGCAGRRLFFRIGWNHVFRHAFPWGRLATGALDLGQIFIVWFLPSLYPSPMTLDPQRLIHQHPSPPHSTPPHPAYPPPRQPTPPRATEH